MSSYQEVINEAKSEYMKALLEKITDLLLVNGIESMKMPMIAKSVDIGVATLYRYFHTKKNLVIACAINVWKRINLLFAGIFESEIYQNKTGYEQIKQLLKIEIVMYQGHADYLKFIAEFDTYVIHENISSVELAEYEANILNVSEKIELAYQKGLKDHSITYQGDFAVFYQTCSHALNALSLKLVNQGFIIESDSLVSGEKQLELLIDIMLKYLREEKI